MPSMQAEIMQKLYRGDIWAECAEPIFEQNVQGWNGDHPTLSRLVATAGRKCIVDVGVWKGQSTINLAAALRENNIDGCVIAVDTFLGSIEHHGHDGLSWFSRNKGRPDLYEVFLNNVRAQGLENYIVPFPQTSVTAAAILMALDIRPNIVHVDAAHEFEEVIRDASLYFELLEVGGFLIGDDYHATWPGVIKAAGEFSARTCLPLTIDPPKWILQKPVS